MLTEKEKKEEKKKMKVGNCLFDVNLIYNNTNHKMIEIARHRSMFFIGFGGKLYKKCCGILLMMEMYLLNASKSRVQKSERFNGRMVQRRWNTIN